MTKELIWVLLVLAIILETYLSYVEDRRHKEAMAKLETRKLEIQARMREADKDLEAMKLETELKLAELDKAHAERTREIDDKLAAAATTEEVV